MGLQRTYALVLGSLLAMSALPSCKTFESDASRWVAVDSRQGLTLKVESLGGDRTTWTLTNGGEPVTFNVVSSPGGGGVPVLELKLTRDSGDEVPYTRWGENVCVTRSFWSTAIMTLERGESGSWIVDLSDIFEPSVGRYQLSGRFGVERGQKGIALSFEHPVWRNLRR